MTAGTEHLISRARPGGRVVFTIWRGDAMAAAGRHLGLAVAAATGTAPAKERERNLFDRINQPGPFSAWLTERGLAEVAVTTHELRLAMTPEVAWLVVIGSGYRGALTRLDQDTVDAVREHYLASLRAEGVTELDATTLIGTGVRAAG